MQNVAVIYLLDAVPHKMLFFFSKGGGYFPVTRTKLYLNKLCTADCIHIHNPGAHSDLANDIVQFNLFNILFKVVGIRWLVVS